MENELLNCPFCGGEADFYLGVSGYLQCTHCLAMIPYDALLPYAEGKKKAIVAWNCRTQPENKPLSIEELRQMDGEPVYCVGIKNQGLTGWGLVCADGHEIVDSNGDFWEFLAYEIEYVAYAHKPEQEEK